VELDSIQGETAVIAKGLAQGEQVVTDGLNQLRPGSKVSVRQPDKPAASAAAPGPSSSAAPKGSGATP
jgi:multidrug efflux system membrane fusion protein